MSLTMEGQTHTEVESSDLVNSDYDHIVKPKGAWDGLCYFIVVFPEPSI